ncbi:MAG: single-stranded-DNA-specific exonuclease RecJ [Marinilabiliales bacterium]|nr:MAG: single-stranded-DNA-specific exonuclease RecJ [Marinilabiliales bacterium]
MEREWIIKEQVNSNEADSLAAELNIAPSLANLLVQRNIKTFDQARVFFRPELTDLHDPFLMKDMGMATERIITAIRKNENILVYGDYDVDGTTSVALVYSFLKLNYPNISFYIPDRFSEGYGISKKAIDFAADSNVSLIIALDCGIKAVEKVAYAKSKNIDFIICDHHMPGDTIPEAAAILDPKQPGCSYPFRELSGCGVGFKLMQALTINSDYTMDELLKLLDMVVVSIASDIVPITGENRILAHWGLKRLNDEPCPGLKSIIKIAGIEKKEITIEDIVFRIGPRINAAGRMKSGNTAVELLIAQDDHLAKEIGGLIDDFNNKRKDVDREITQEAIRMIAADSEYEDRKSTVLFNPDWSKGVIGIVASRLIETYYRPTVILTESNGLATGSARSVPGFDIYQVVEACSDLLENFGGHMYAAGMTMKIGNVETFRKRFEALVSGSITPDQLSPKIDLDAVISIKEIDDRFCRILQQFQPFGPENTSPIFLARNLVAGPNIKIVGPTREHLKMEVFSEDAPGHIFQAIAFHQAEHYKLISYGIRFDACFTVEENVFRGASTWQLNIRDIKTREDS